MDIHFYSTESSHHTIGKVLGSPETIQIRLKANVDIIRPFLVLRDSEAFDFADFNYAEIPELGRFYFIESSRRRTNELIELQLHVDVLETYKDDILNSKARYRRGIEVGDYGEAMIEVEAKFEITTYDSDVNWPEGASLVMTTVGE